MKRIGIGLRISMENCWCFRSGSIVPAWKGLQVRTHRSGTVVAEADLRLELGGCRCECCSASTSPLKRSRLHKCGLGLASCGSQKRKESAEAEGVHRSVPPSAEARKLEAVEDRRCDLLTAPAILQMRSSGRRCGSCWVVSVFNPRLRPFSLTFHLVLGDFESSFEVDSHQYPKVSNSHPFSS